MKEVSLLGRKRIHELGGDAFSEAKKQELLTLKLQQMNQDAEVAGTLQLVPLEQIRSDPNQPRKQFRNIESLAASIREQGIIQPIITTPKQADGYYQIIAGERRFLAARQAGLSVAPCIIRPATDANILILQLLENDQRESVSPIEEAEALSKLVDQMGISKAQVAKELGREPAWVSIRLGLQHSSESIRTLVSEGKIEDVRTLHELRMLEKEAPQKAQQLIEKIAQNRISGSYRQAIANARKTKNSAKAPLTRRVNKIERSGSQLLMHVVGTAHPLTFEVSSTVWSDFVDSLKKS